MWQQLPTDEFSRSVKWYAKKRKRELTAVLDNLDTYLKALSEGMRPQHKLFGFQHAEPHGVWAIDQKGGGKSLAETRLYIYPDTATETLHLIALGDKNTQNEDIKFCNDFVAELLKKEPQKDDRAEEANRSGGEEALS